MYVNVKSSCLVIGKDFGCSALPQMNIGNEFINWVNKCSYLGVIIVARKFFCANVNIRCKKFFGAAIMIFCPFVQFCFKNILCTLSKSKFYLHLIAYGAGV